MRTLNHPLLAIAAVLLGAAAGCSGPPTPTTETAAAPVAPAQGVPSAGRIVVKDAGLATPESVLHDAQADVYLVSNINGNPAAKDGNGFISRLAPDGTVTTLKWIEGGRDGVTLNAPKGTALIGERLWVADIDALRAFDRTSGAPRETVEVPGATFLNDLAVGADGSLYASDSGIAFTADGVKPTGSAAIYRLDPEGTLHTIAKGAALEAPNGLLDTPDHGLVMVPFGGNTVFSVAPDGTLRTVATLPKGSLDGVVRTNDARLLVSSWDGSAVYAVSASGEVSTLLDGLTSPADIGFDGARDRLLIPLFNLNQVVIQPLSQPSR